MPVRTEWIRYGDQRGFLAFPERATMPLPAVLVIQEIWGVDPFIEDVAKRVAAAGYVALAPDLMAKNGVLPSYFSPERIAQTQQFLSTVSPALFRDPAARELELAKLPDKQRTEVNETFTQALAMTAGLSDMVPPLKAAVHHLRNEQTQTKNQKVACVGFCMGGGLSALLACDEPELSGAAIYYGMSPSEDKIANIKCPIIGFYGENDQRVSGGVPSFETSMKNAGKSFEYHIYTAANHGFFNETGRAYDVNASRDSFVRLLSFFQKYLTP